MLINFVDLRHKGLVSPEFACKHVFAENVMNARMLLHRSPCAKDIISSAGIRQCRHWVRRPPTLCSEHLCKMMAPTPHFCMRSVSSTPLFHSPPEQLLSTFFVAEIFGEICLQRGKAG